MILSYDLPDDDVKSQNSEKESESPMGPNLGLKQSSSSSSFSKDIGSNIFVYDPKYSNTFSKNKVQNDEIFYEKYEYLKDIKKGGSRTELSSSHNDSGLSLTEGNFINTDVLKMINSSHVRIYLNINNIEKRELVCFKSVLKLILNHRRRN